MPRKKKPRFFVTDAPVPIYEFDPSETIADREPNVIWIKSRMDVETSGKVSSELVKVDDQGKAELYAGAQQTALLIHNIVRWEGPDFEQLDDADQVMRDGQGRPIYVPVTPENIRQLDHRDPFIERVIDEIGERNKKRASPKATSPTANISTSDTLPGSGHMPKDAEPPNVSLQLATGRSRSSLLNAVDGRLDRSENSTPTT